MGIVLRMVECKISEEMQLEIFIYLFIPPPIAL